MAAWEDAVRMRLHDCRADAGPWTTMPGKAMALFVSYIMRVVLAFPVKPS
jgi:hypothetical protein